MKLLGTQKEYGIEIQVNTTSGWNIISLHKTLDDARKRLNEYKARSILLDKRCEFRIVMLQTTKSEVDNAEK